VRSGQLEHIAAVSLDPVWLIVLREGGVREPTEVFLMKARRTGRIVRLSYLWTRE